ncbi:hypothetical protein Leryth_014516 [Lithospermum erythrorhizon]|nr:hypothetical protein Leryth_014516 [Lithospermum erythrorhizon]
MQVVIEGFKSYKEQVSTEPFSSKVNCVVGANGSGKSNFFHAIRFVISDLFHNLRSEERQALLHEGAGHQLLSAFVEIVFDNSDNRFPVDKEEIASLTLMKDSERLDLLKEIGGTRVYEERRRESLKIMQETGNKRKQIIQVVQYLDERLRELDEEKEELKKYQQLDKQRKALEYTIYDKELHDARQKLLEVEEARDKISEQSTKMYDGVQDAHEKSKELDKEFKDLTKEVQILNREKESIEKQRTEAIKRRAQFELDDKDLREKMSGNSKAKDEAAKQLELLEKEIKESDHELGKIRPLCEKQIHEEQNITKGIMEREKQLSILYQKQGRATQFSNKAARDKWLQKEIDEYERVLSSNQMQERKLKDEFEQIKKEVEKQDVYIKDRKEKASGLESYISLNRGGYNQYKTRRDELHEERKSLWQKESEISAEIERLKSEVVKAEKSLDHATPGDIRRGLGSVRRICREYDIKGVFGPLFELLDCDEKFFTAVEVTNDDISTQIIRHLNAQKGGRVTFIPLNRVRPPRVTYPQSSDVLPLLKKLKFSHEFSPAFGQVFAKTVVCRDLDVATKVARTDSLDCITLEGDQVSKKGGMTGGFYDYKRSKLKFMSIIKQNMKTIKVKEDELKKVREELQDILKNTIDQKINEVVGEQQKNDAKLSHDRSELEQLKQDIANAEKQKQSISKSLEKKEKMLANVLTQIDQLRANLAMKRDEMGTELVDHLTPEEKDKLSQTRVAELEMNLSTNLVRRKQELEAIIQATEVSMLDAEADLKRQELRDAHSAVENLSEHLKRVSRNINERNQRLKGIKTDKDKLKRQEEEYQSTLQDEAKELEQLVSKRKFFLAKQEEYSKKIRELGLLSSDAFETYKRRSIKDLNKMLHKCNEQLQQFSHVNKKALDQYVNFTEQREELQKRQAELDAGDEKIKELISVLDMRKDESIERTFKGVAKHFREVFSELVQGGHGFLVMMKKKDGDEADNDLDDDEPRAAMDGGRVEKYIGVKVKVSFTGQGETQSMKQLSGDAALDPQYRTAVGNMVRCMADVANTQTLISRTSVSIVAERLNRGVTGVAECRGVNFILVFVLLITFEESDSFVSLVLFYIS